MAKISRPPPTQKITSLKRGEIYLASFPFGNAPGMKLRPVLLLTSPIGTSAEVVAVYISSVIPATLLPSDIVLDPQTPEFASTGLKVISLLRLHKLATIHSSSVQRFLGSLSASALQEVDTKLRAVLNL